MMDIGARGASHVGKTREKNEDAIGIDVDRGIFVLADGMGGHESGAKASKASVAAVHAAIGAEKAVLERFAKEPTEANRQAAVTAVVGAFEKTCAQVFEMGREGQTRRRMGSTLDAVVRVGERVIIGHVGDGRIYLVRQGQCNLLTEDHTIVAAQIKAGILTEAEANDSRFKGVLTRAIGTHQAVSVDTLVLELEPGDRILMCSDGLHRYAKPVDLARLLGPNPEPTVVNKLVDHANACGGEDNISVILIACSASAAAVAAAAPAGKPDMSKTLSDTSMGRAAARVDAITRLPLFQNLTYREQVAVLAVAQPRTFEEGAVIVKQGAPGQEMFVIIDGQLVVERDGRKIADLGPGGHFGEMSLVDDTPRSASVRAKTRSDVLALGQNEINALMRIEPVLAVKILWNFVNVLSARLRAASAEIIELQMDQAPVTSVRAPFVGP